MRPTNRRQPLKTQLGKPTYAYKIASGRPFWPSRDPLADESFFADFSRDKSRKERLKLRDESLGNIYSFVNNDGTNRTDYLGLADEEKCCADLPNFGEILKLLSTAVGLAADYADHIENGPGSAGGLITAIGSAANEYGGFAIAAYLRAKGLECHALVIGGGPTKLCTRDCDFLGHLATQLAVIFND